VIDCELCEWRGFVSELAEHDWVEHGLGNWGGPDCEHCGGNGEILARTPQWNGDERWDLCTACRGRGFVA
jgi:hypothetical protein